MPLDPGRQVSRGRLKNVWAGLGPNGRVPAFYLEGRIRMESHGFPTQEGRGGDPGHSPRVSPALPELPSSLSILQLQGLIQLSEHLKAFTPTDLWQGRTGIKEY